MYSKFSVEPKKLKKVAVVIVCLVAVFMIQKLRMPYYKIPPRQEAVDREQVLSSDVEEGKEEVLDMEPHKVVIYVTGEVKQPGIVELSSDMRLKDALQMVGGFTAEADINSINLAQKVEDERHYVVTKIGETITEAGIPSSSTSKEDSLININIATAEELKRLDGIGDGLAQRIINHRTEQGAFSSIEEIKNVNGIGEKKFEAIKDSICVK
ncbi:helix-hairpin-helix domain-containing protein [Filifactor villosus]|uniref:Helix-hairpin-helix domain-containing protein n=1 Tax=Filifactor villosus TaxID=29374 RepID=A0ABV9QL98_9FIRM